MPHVTVPEPRIINQLAQKSSALMSYIRKYIQATHVAMDRVEEEVLAIEHTRESHNI